MVRPRRSPSALSHDLDDGELVVLSPDGLEAMVLNATGGAVWDLCDGTHTRDDMARIICETLGDADATAVAKQVNEFVLALRARGLVEDVA